MPVQELIHQELTEKINGCAISVPQFIGPGFPGIVHKPALMIELEITGLLFNQEVETDIKL